MLKVLLFGALEPLTGTAEVLLEIWGMRLLPGPRPTGWWA